jgi:hypothetical protein
MTGPFADGWRDTLLIVKVALSQGGKRDCEAELEMVVLIGRPSLSGGRTLKSSQTGEQRTRLANHKTIEDPSGQSQDNRGPVQPITRQ